MIFKYVFNIQEEKVQMRFWNSYSELLFGDNSKNPKRFQRKDKLFLES